MSNVTYDRPGFSLADLPDYEDDERGYDVREEAGGRGPLILALAGGVLVVFGAVVWNTYAKGFRLTDDGIPLVLAEKGPIKEVPKDPGGMVQPDVSRRVYEQIETAPGESGLVIDATVKAPSSGTPGGGADLQLVGGPPTDLRPGLELPEKNTDTVISEEALPPPRAAKPLPDAKIDAELDALRGIPPEEPGSQVASMEPMAASKVPPPAAAPAQPEPLYNFSTGGAYLVQLAALRSEQSAIAAWDKIALRYPDDFRGASRLIQRADLGAKGVFYRLRVGSFDVREDAVAFCDALKAKKETCIVVER